MSHGHERPEKICLNCNAVVYGRYCHLCGQENIEVKERFRDVSKHLVYDITHFDSKFFDTIRYLLFRPGYLTYEYLRGRRQRYLNPIKMYVFVSALFFLSMAFFNARPIVRVQAGDDKKKEKPTEVDRKNDSMVNAIQRSAGLKPEQAKKPVKVGGTTIYNPNYDQDSLDADLADDSIAPKTVEAYRREQDSLPASERDSWFLHMLNEKRLAADLRHQDDGGILKVMSSELAKEMPKLMFLLLPLNAVLLMLFYRRKKMFYVQHLFFLVHVVCAVYLLLIFINLFEAGIHLSYIGTVCKWMTGITQIYLVYYVYKALRNFYEQGRGKTILKYFLLTLITSIISSFVILLAGFIFYLFR